MSSLIPVKLMTEWKELLFNGLPLYEPLNMEGQQPRLDLPTAKDAVELEKQEILNKQDYDEYTVSLKSNVKCICIISACTLTSGLHKKPFVRLNCDM